jgi:ribokinase
VPDAADAASKLLQHGVQNVVVTLGANGALICNNDGTHHEQAESVKVVDTTGAGDTFNGVFAAKLAEGKHQRDAIQFAVQAATLSVQYAGVRSVD